MCREVIIVAQNDGVCVTAAILWRKEAPAYMQCEVSILHIYLLVCKIHVCLFVVCSHTSEKKPLLKVEGEWNGVMHIKHPNGVSTLANPGFHLGG